LPTSAIAREAGAGTRDLFNEVVMGGIDHDTPGADWYRSGNGEVWAMIASSEGAIGYLSLNYSKDGVVRAIAYDGVVPSAETVRDESYPLATTLSIYTLGEADPNERAFLDFVTGDRGRSIAEDLDFFPISARLRRELSLRARQIGEP